MDTESLTVCTKRCAIYTRKSLQPPDSREITSLQTQRAICSSYIASQQHKGWSEIAKGYDDAAYSGSTLQRPALQQLLADIETGMIDVVLVYKLDRITRTLLDFARLIDLFDRYGVAFVAITQNFDTSDSMGRLIRNILLTFAQFEREIASDRMRDKLTVMKQRGHWAGGPAPTGYDLGAGKLIRNAREAQTVRWIFQTYANERQLTAVHRKLVATGFKRDGRGTAAGRRDCSQLTVCSLRYILSNPVYIGEVRHRDRRYPGIHEPIVDRDLWERVQQILQERRVPSPKRESNLLTGLIFDGFGRRMHARHNSSKWGAFRYYVSSTAAWATLEKVRAARARANDIEELVRATIADFLADRLQLRAVMLNSGISGLHLDRVASAALPASERLSRLSPKQLSYAFRALVSRVEVLSDVVRIVLRVNAVPRFVEWDGAELFVFEELGPARESPVHVIEIAASMNRERKTYALPVKRRDGQPKKPNKSLISLLEDAHQAQQLVFENRDLTVADLACCVGKRPAVFAKLVRLNYLAPDIVAAILDGEQPASMTRKSLMGSVLPIDWALQRRLLGFEAVYQSEPVAVEPPSGRAAQ